MKAKSAFFVGLVVAMVGVAPDLFAVVLVDFEGIAPGPPTCMTPPCQTIEDPARGLGVNPRTFNGFDVFTEHGHYEPFNLPLIVAGQRPDNGTDWFLHDHSATLGGVDFGANDPVIVKRSNGGKFSLLSIDASEWDRGLPLNQTLTLTGHFTTGVTTTASFTTDNTFGFETFFVAGFSDIVRLDIIGSSAAGFGPCVGFAVCGSLGYDNLTFRIAEPTTTAVLGLGLVFLGVTRPRRRFKAVADDVEDRNTHAP